MSAIPFIEADTGAAGVRAVFTTRDGGSSTGPFATLNLSASTGDDLDAVRANRRATASALGFDADRAVVLEQVHGAAVVHAGPEGGRGSYAGALDAVDRGDASVTTARGVALHGMGADCPAVLLWCADGSAVAAAHAGWRGLVGGVLQAAVEAMPGEPAGMKAVVGPCVRPCCYPVGDDLRTTMAARFGDAVVVGDAVDLSAAARRALAQAGLAPTAISVVDECTSCSDRFFSYRRDGAATGRHAGIVWRVEEHA